MNKNILLIIFLLFVTTNALSQRWTYKKGGDAFDGKYRSASIEGYGTDAPYNDPLFVVNYFKKSKSLNLYISEAGYAGCDNKIIKIKFNNNDTIYTFDVSTNSDKDVWFLHEYTSDFYDYNTLTIDQLLKKLMKYRTLFVRISSDCGKSDLEFSLNGSSKAINFVLPENYFAIQKKKRIKKKQEKIEERQRREARAKYNEFIEQGNKYKKQDKYDSAIMRYKMASEIMPDYKKPVNKIEKVKKIIEKEAKISEMKRKNKFYVETGTKLYPNPDGTGESIIHVSSDTFVKILDENKGKNNYIYVLYKGNKGYINKMALRKE